MTSVVHHLAAPKVRAAALEYKDATERQGLGVDEDADSAYDHVVAPTHSSRITLTDLSVSKAVYDGEPDPPPTTTTTTTTDPNTAAEEAAAGGSGGGGGPAIPTPTTAAARNMLPILVLNGDSSFKITYREAPQTTEAVLEVNDALVRQTRLLLSPVDVGEVQALLDAFAGTNTAAAAAGAGAPADGGRRSQPPPPPPSSHSPFSLKVTAKHLRVGMLYTEHNPNDRLELASKFFAGSGSFAGLAKLLVFEMNAVVTYSAAGGTVDAGSVTVNARAARVLEEIWSEDPSFQTPILSFLPRGSGGGGGGGGGAVPTAGTHFDRVNGRFARVGQLPPPLDAYSNMDFDFTVQWEEALRAGAAATLSVDLAPAQLHFEPRLLDRVDGILEAFAATSSPNQTAAVAAAMATAAVSPAPPLQVLVTTESLEVILGIPIPTFTGKSNTLAHLTCPTGTSHCITRGMC